MNFREPQQDIIFSDFIHSVSCDVELGNLSDAAKLIREQNPLCAEFSAKGGYHSPVFRDASEERIGAFDELIDGVKWYVTRFLKERYGKELPIRHFEWWFMINNRGDYNVPHVHGKADLSAVFYVKAPENCGNLVLNRTGGSRHSALPDTKAISITPEDGMLHLFPSYVQHWVEPSESDEERISIAMNVFL